MINELKEGSIKEPFLLTKKEVKETKTGKAYLDIELMDQTGTIGAKLWGADSIAVDVGEVVIVSGKAEKYQEKMQIIISSMVKDNDADITAFLKTSKFSAETLWNTIDQYIALISDDECKSLVKTVFAKYKDRFEKMPAATKVHHNYVAGLLEHSCFVTINAYKLAENYAFINKDLVITTALLHDIGKLDELEMLPKVDYTTEGNLLGHIFIGANELSKEMNNLHFSKEKHDKIIHCILAHHGKLEYGSPKLPTIPEALILNIADDLDAKMKIFQEDLDAKSKSKNYFLGVIPMSGMFESDLNFN